MGDMEKIKEKGKMENKKKKDMADGFITKGIYEPGVDKIENA